MLTTQELPEYELSHAENKEKKEQRNLILGETAFFVTARSTFISNIDYSSTQ